jgi:hypothetical protein
MVDTDDVVGTLGKCAETSAESIRKTDEPSPADQPEKGMSKVKIEGQEENNKHMVQAAALQNQIGICDNRGQGLFQAQQGTQQTDPCKQEAELLDFPVDQCQTGQGQQGHETDKGRDHPQIRINRQTTHGSSPTEKVIRRMTDMQSSGLKEIRNLFLQTKRKRELRQLGVCMMFSYHNFPVLIKRDLTRRRISFGKSLPRVGFRTSFGVHA